MYIGLTRTVVRESQALLQKLDHKHEVKNTKKPTQCVEQPGQRKENTTSTLDHFQYFDPSVYAQYWRARNATAGSMRRGFKTGIREYVMVY